MSDIGDGFSLQVSVTVSPENRDAFLAALKPVYDLVAAEPECTYFEVYESSEVPGVINWVENWKQTTDWFMKNQLPKDYYKEYFAITEPMYIKPREFQIVKRLKPADWTRCKETNLQ